MKFRTQGNIHFSKKEKRKETYISYDKAYILVSVFKYKYFISVLPGSSGQLCKFHFFTPKLEWGKILRSFKYIGGGGG